MMLQGWVCPTCGAAVSPWVRQHCVKKVPHALAATSGITCGVCERFINYGVAHTCKNGMTVIIYNV